MKRKIIAALASVVVFGFASTGSANEAQPELQPTPLEFGWFKRPVESTSAVANIAPISTQAGNDYRFLTDYSPN